MEFGLDLLTLNYRRCIIALDFVLVFGFLIAWFALCVGFGWIVLWLVWLLVLCSGCLRVLIDLLVYFMVCLVGLLSVICVIFSRYLLGLDMCGLLLLWCLAGICCLLRLLG